jgi:hypothetical protein
MANLLAIEIAFLFLRYHSFFLARRLSR